MRSKVPMFMTINGLKVRLDIEFCKEYLKENTIELWLWSIEAFGSLASICAIIYAVFCVINDTKTINIIIGTIIAYYVGYYISKSLLLMSILMVIYVPLYKLYSILQKLFVPYVVLFIIAYISKSYNALGVFIISRLICCVIENIFNTKIIKYYNSKYNVVIGDIEVTAYKLHLCFCDERLELNNWIEKYSEYIYRSNNEIIID